MDNKSLIVSKKSFFYRIKSFFKSMFNRDDIQEEIDYSYNKIKNEPIKKSSFNEDIKIKPDLEREKLLKMQRDYENGLIKEEEMTAKQVEGIEKLYIEQITKLRNDFTIYKNRVIEMKKKLAMNQ